MKTLKLFAIVITLLLLVGCIVTTSHILNKQEKEQQKQFYIGVTYCGDSAQEAKELIDKVKNYTNLFILQSGSLQWNITAMDEIGDYAISSGLKYAVFGVTTAAYVNRWLNTAKERWGEHFIGIYYNDERGGKMLDDNLRLEDIIEWDEKGDSMGMDMKTTKYKDGSIRIVDNDTQTTYYPDGTIYKNTDMYYNETPRPSHSIGVQYYPNGTIIVYETDWDMLKNNNVYTSGNITQYLKPVQPYEEILKQNPVQTIDDAARVFVNANKATFEDYFLKKSQLEETIVIFTSDYGLYWWDYQSGYDLVLAELGWNHTTAQDIALVRGAANLQNKSWGTIITWKYTHAPYLPNGEEMFELMKISYQTGAQYVIIFNYSEDKENPNTLQEEHFQALERFWNDIVQNPKIKHGSIKAEAALVLPQNYGWGMRHIDDKIWGIWPADDTSQTIWNQLQNKLDKHGLELDIVYEDPNHPVAGKYANIYYWNQKT